MEPPETLELLEAIAPSLREARERLTREARRMRGPFDPETVEGLLFAGLPGQLLGVAGRVLILELHIARLQELLQGPTPQDRFRSFLEHLRDPDVAAALLQEYPVLAQQLSRCIDQWVAFGTDFLEHLTADWPLFQGQFGTDPGPLTHLEMSGGDRHRGGRSVLLATFASGLRLVYKPRSLTIDLHFQEFLDWANDRGASPSFRRLAVLDRGNHGWVEFVPHESCKTPDEVRRFYERLGGYMAMMHVLIGSDLHYENVVAMGEHPVLVDLEVLFHPLPPGWSGRGPGERALADSVLATGLLPRREFTEGGAEGADISGLGAAAGQLSPAAELCLEGAGTDEMRLVRRRVELAVGRHRPTLAGAEVNPLPYRAALADGFTRIYRLIREHRAELLAPGGLLERFAGDEVRYLFRPTRAYAILLQQCGHPDRLRDPREQEVLFDRLQAGIEHHPVLANLLPHERADLAGGDVPLFTARPDSVDLWASSGARIANFFEGTGLDRSRHRLEQMSDADLARNLSALHAALCILPGAADFSPRPCTRGRGVGGEGADVAKAKSPSPPTPLPRSTGGEGRVIGAALAQQALSAARAVGDRLETLAWRTEADIGWLGLKADSNGRWGIAPLGLDLYDGLPGVALFLAHLGETTGEKRYTALARAALAGMRTQLAQSANPIRLIGAFEGWGGIIYVLTHLAVLWDEPELQDEALSAFHRLVPLIDSDEELDVIGGAAGALLCLLAHHRCFSSPEVIAAAVRCGEHLLARSTPQVQGIGWMTKLPTSAPLTGLAHGAAGISWALVELAEVTGNARFRQAGLDAVAYERSRFDPLESNWPDFRPSATAKSPRFQVAWCHGAPGIGLTRLRILRHLPDPILPAEIRAAIETTCARGFGFNHSLCHGDLGSAEVVLEAGRAFDESSWLAAGRLAVSRVLESIRGGGWLSATPDGTETPGLMTGLAGIGYGLLRQANPDRVPSVLSLMPPTRTPDVSHGDGSANHVAKARGGAADGPK